MSTPTSPSTGPGQGPRLHRYLEPPVISVALLVMAAGFGQFAAVATLGDVAEEFGAATDDPSLAEEAGLSGTTLGLGLAVIRLASLGALPLAGLADRLGRRRTVNGLCALGLALTAAAALSPGYWWFVVIFSLSRPLLTATNAVAEVVAAEQTDKAHRAKAIALVAAGYGIGSGLIAVVRGIGAEALGFRGVFALALLPLVLVAVAGRRVSEPDRFRAAEARKDRPLPVLGAVQRRFRSRLVPLAALVFAVAAVTGPANSFMFVYAENVRGRSPAFTALMVLGAGASGLVGLLLGRWAADRLGRRVTGGAAMGCVAAAGILTYSGSTWGLVVGYEAAVLTGAAFAPAAGAMHAELFPTSVRASVAGWLVASGVLGAVTGLLAFGAVADVGGRWGLAAIAVFVPAAAVSVLFALLPETRGLELEDVEEDR